MATNYLALLRKSYFNKLLFSSLLSNMVVFGQPLQEMILSAKLAPVKPATGVSYTAPGLQPGRNVLPDDKVLHTSHTPPQGHYPATKFTVFYANETQAIVGTDPLSGIENPYDNFFTVQLPQGLDSNAYETVLTYELYGVAGAAQTTKRINTMPAYGGKVVTISQQWNTVSETLPPGYLKPGANEVFFNRRGEEMYQYKVRNLRVELKEKTGNDLVFYAAQPPGEDKSLHLTATVLNPEIKEIKVLGQTIPVYEGVAEKVLANQPEHLTSLNAAFTTSKGEQHITVPVVQEVVMPQYNFPASVLAANAAVFTPADFSGEGVAYEAVTLQAKGKVGENSHVAVSGLQFKDLKALNPDMEIVTGGSYTGYRIQQLNFPDSVATNIYLKYDPEKIPTGYTAQDVRTYYYDAAQRTWQQLAVDSIDIQKNEVVVKAYGNDTDYINGVIKVPDSPETSSFAPTTITDMKLADPSAGVVSIAPPTPNNNGAASTGFPIKLPQGRHGQQPGLQVSYSSEAGNSWMGLGWNLSLPAISLNTKWGAPRFDTAKETELYAFNGSELVLKVGSVYTNPHRLADITRVTDRQFYERKEGTYQQIIRKGSTPSTYYWIVTDKHGNKSYYGNYTNTSQNEDAVIRTGGTSGPIAYWALKKTEDTYGNYVEYYYTKGTVNIGSSTVTAQEFYPASIRYTLSSSTGITSYYEVAFKRNSYTVSSDSNLTYTARPDVMVNSRNGFLQITDDLLTEIHVSLIQPGQTTRIRTYRFDYQTMPFQKRQLKVIAEFDTANLLFYTNTLEYYDDYGSGSIISGTIPWTLAAHDNVSSALGSMAPTSLVLPNGSALGTSTSSGLSFGLRAGFGIGSNVKSTNNTGGGSYNYSPGDNETRISFIDINGDGLADKVIGYGNTVSYRPQIKSGSNHTFGSLMPIPGLTSIGNTKSRTNGTGVDANALGMIGVGKSWSKTKSTTDNYFTDFNGDGLPDMVSGGRVKFNITTPSASSTEYRTFEQGSVNSENLISAGAVDPSIIPYLQLETLNELREQYPQFDHVKVWQAPYTGAIKIEGQAKLVVKNNNSDNNTNHFKLTVEKANFNQSGNLASLAYTGASADLTTQGQTANMVYNTNTIAVNKGDILFFRIHNKDYGYGGEVQWNPIVYYTGMATMTYATHKDDTNKQLNRFEAQPDYIMNNDGGIELSDSSSVSVTLDFNTQGLLAPYEVSDDVSFTILKLRTYTSNGNQSLIGMWTVNCNHATGVPSGGEIYTDTYTPSTNGSYTDRYYLGAESDSNIDWNTVNWKPTISAPSGTFYPGVNYFTYDDNVNQKPYWFSHSSFPMPTISSDGAANYMMISHNFFSTQSAYVPVFNQLDDSEFPLRVSWLVKEALGSTTKTLRKRTFYVVKDPNGNYILSKTTATNTPVTSADTDFFEYPLTKQYVKNLKDNSGMIYTAFYIHNKNLGAYGSTVNNAAITLREHPDQGAMVFTDIVLQSPYMARSARFCGYTHRGWGQFLYNGGIEFEHDDEGNITNLSTPYSFGNNFIDITTINFEAQAANAQDIPQDIEADDLTMPNTTVRYSFYNQVNQTNKYKNDAIINATYGFNGSGLLTAVLGRFGESSLYNVYIDPDDIVSNEEGVFPGMKQRAESKGKAKSGNLTYVSGTESEAESTIYNQYIDLNGDRYPEIVTSGKIQYTGMLGALSGVVMNNDFSSGDKSQDRTVGATIPLSPKSTESNDGDVTGNKTITNTSSGINHSEGESFDARQWNDMNGDGLPDKVKITDTQVKVWLNTGYGFTPEIIWGSGSGMLTSQRENNSAGLSLPFSPSFALGFGAAISEADMANLLVDVNGDGLPDLVRHTVSGTPPIHTYTYRLNTGTGFVSATGTFYSGSNSAERDYGISGNAYGSFTWGFPIPTPIPLLTLKMVFTPTASANGGINEKRATIQDLDGDGLSDIIFKSGTTNSSNISASKNKIGRTHLLKKVNTPLGGSWTINYTKDGNTYNLPQNKWVLTSIETHDGFTGDSAFGPSTTKTAVSYKDPKQDRREREFLGYGTVTVQEIDPTNSTVYRTAETAYHTENIYLSGLAKETILYDSGLQMLSKESTLYNILDPDTPVVNAAATAVDNYLQASLIATGADLLDRSRLFVAPAKTTATTYEGSQELSASKEFLSYNGYGNLLEYRDNGEGPDDAYKTVITYHTVSQYMPYGPGFPSKVSVYKNAGSVLMREREATYYNTTGGLYEISTKLNTAGDYGKARFAYDAFGNMTQVSNLENKNSANTAYYTSNVTYDTAFKMFPISTTNGYGETSTVQAYNFLFGVPVLVRDVNGQDMRTRIDNRGRVIEVTGPNEMAVEAANGGNAWTIRMEYENEAVLGTIASGTYMVNAVDNFIADAPGSAVATTKKHHAVTRHFDPEYATGNGLTSTNHFLTMSLVDGFGQPIQVKKTHQTGSTTKWMVSGFVKKDAFGRVLESYLPIVESTYPSNPVVAISPTSAYNYNPGTGIQPFTIMTYDAKDRVITKQQMGITGDSNVEYSIAGGRYVQKYTNELDQTMEAYTDVRGRQRKTVQNDEITRTFEYNAINELTKVIDNEGFPTEYLYDLAGRTIETHNPDRGVVTFKYDKASRLTEQSNSNLLPGGQKVSYFYNYSRVERIEYPQNPQNNVSYTYGVPGNQLAIDERAIGRLLTQEDATGKQLFSYGRMGELVEHLRSVAVADYQSYWFFTQWKYDSWNRVQEITYPDQEVVTYAYNKAGAIQGINSQMNGIAGGVAQPVVSNILYNDFGERVSITHGSGSGATTTTYSYDARHRMNTLAHTFSNLSIAKSYTYDALSNITDITTATPQNSLPGTGNIGGPIKHHYEYDDYNRLEHAEGVYTGANDLTTPYMRTTYSLDMEYNTDHTIKKKTQLQEQGWVNAYSDTAINDLRPVQKTSYTLDYGGYGDASIMMGSYGYQQPHAPRTITESPSWVTSPAPDDPRIKQKKILYDANGNQTEIKEVLGEVETSLRKNLWDEANRLKAVNLKPDDPTAHPIAIYTYDAGGARTIRYNYDRIDVSSNATEVGQARKDNVMVYPSGLIMGKAARMRKDGTVYDNTLVYTKHYYIGSERVSAKTGTLAKFGDYPQTLVNSKMAQMATVGTTLMRTPSTVTQQEATATVVSIHNTFGVTPPTIPAVQQESTMTYGAHDQNLLNSYYFHPDHLGSSSYITNSSGVVCQHMEYLPFGETFVDEHLNSNNSPFKYNGKELDEETGNYYYGARYYDPKLSIFISVDPLADKYPGISPYAYCFNNPVRLIDPTGMEPDDPEGCLHDPPGGSHEQNHSQEPVHKEYSVTQYRNFFEKSHNVTMDGNQEIMLNLGCIGLTDLELYNPKDPYDESGFKMNKFTGTTMPKMDYAYSTLDKAIEVMDEQNRMHKDNNKEGRAFVFAIRYYVSNEKEGLPNEKGEIDMSNWRLDNVKIKGQPTIPFDYGVYNEKTKLFWHANEANNSDGVMRVYLSDATYFANEYPRSFNRTVYCVGYSPYPEGVESKD